jgi:hypothetical protein
MPNIGKISTLAAVMAATLLVLLLKWQHLTLAAAISSGQIDGRAITVTEMAPVAFAGRTSPFECGELRFDAPADATTEIKPPDQLCGLQLRVDGLLCRVFPPRHEPQPDEIDWAVEFNRQGIDWQAAACRASRQDLSFWMNQREVESLQERLEAKMFLSLLAERVEVFNNEALCGLLLIWDFESRPRMEFNYFTPDHELSGTVLFMADSGDPETMNTVRAIIGSLRIEHTPAGQPALAMAAIDYPSR